MLNPAISSNAIRITLQSQVHHNIIFCACSFCSLSLLLPDIMTTTTVTDISTESVRPCHHYLQTPEALGLSQQIPLQPVKNEYDAEPEGPLSNVALVQQRWNSPRINKWRLTAVFLTFFNLGANDASYGVGLLLLLLLFRSTAYLLVGCSKCISL